MPRRLHAAGWLWCWALLFCLALLPTVSRAAPALPLQDSAGQVDAWPAITLLSDADGSLDSATVLRRLDRFQPPNGPHGNLGMRRDVVWLQLRVSGRLIKDQESQNWKHREYT